MPIPAAPTLWASANALPEATYPPSPYWIAAATEPAATPAAVNPITVKAAGAATTVRAPAAPAQQTSAQLHLAVNIIKEVRLIIA